MFAKLRPKPLYQSNRKLVRPLVECLETRLAPAIVDWVTNADGNWNDCGSWRVRGTNPPVFRCPGANDDAVISVAVDALITFSGNHQVRTLDVSERLRMTSGTLSIAGAAPLSSAINRLEQNPGSVLQVLANSQLTLNGSQGLNGTINVATGATLGVANFSMAGTINAAANAAVGFFGCGVMSLEPGAALSGTGTYTLFGSVLCGPRLTLNGNISVPNLDLNTNGGIGGDGALTVTNTLTFRSGEIGGTGTVTLPAGSTMNIIEHHSKTLNRRTLNLSGTANWRDAGAALGFANSAVFNNLASGTINLYNDTEFLRFNGTFNNAGTLNKMQLQEPGQSSLGARFNNTGIVNVRSGSLTVFGQGTTSGRIQVDAGTTFELFYGNNIGPFAIEPGASFTGAGTFQLDGNGNGRVVLNTNVAFPNFVMNESVLVGAGNLTIDSRMNWNGGVIGGEGTVSILSGATLTLGGGREKALDGTRTLNNDGTTVFVATQRFALALGATFNNRGLFRIEGNAVFDSYLYDFSPPGTINNTGTWIKSSEGVSVINVIFNTSRPVAVSAGELRLNRGGTSTSTFDVAEGAGLAITGLTYQFNEGTALTGSGIFRIDNATLGLNTDLTLGTMIMERGANLTGARTLTVTNSLVWNRGTMLGTGTTTIAEGALLNFQTNETKVLGDSRTLTIAGSATWSDGGNIFLNSPATTVDVRGVFSVENDRVLQGNGRLINTGTLNKTSGGVTTFDANFENRGLVNVVAGQLVLRSGTSSGVFNMAASATTAFIAGLHRLQAGTIMHGEGTASVAGGTVMIDAADVTALNFALQSGSVDGTGTLTVLGLLDWTGGEMSNSAGRTRIESGAVLSLSGNAGRTLSGRIVEVAGTLSWVESGGLGVNTNGTIDVLPGGYLEINNATDLTMSGSGIINNAGILAKFGPAQLNLTGITVNDNGGVVSLLEGVVNLGRYIVNSGYTEVYSTLIATAGVELRGGELFLAGGQITGNVTLAERDAVVSGFGTVTGNLANGGQVNVGGIGAAGMLTIGGNFTQTSIGVLNLELGGLAQGSEYDTLDVRGTATLDGILNVSLINEYFPAVSDSFRILDVLRTRTGTFARINLPAMGDLRLEARYDANGLILETV